MTVDTRRLPSAVDAAFARFCAKRDVEALATVFDATAPRLILVAAHLAGDGFERTIEFVTRRLTLRIVDGHDAPVKDVRVCLWQRDLSIQSDQRTDDSGRAVFDPCTRGPLTASVSTDGTTWLDLGPVAVPPGERAASLELRVPDR